MAHSSQPYIVGNWKMNGLAAALAEIDALVAALEGGEVGDVPCAVCPPATLIERVRAHAGERLAIGGQDCAVEAKGAKTGDVSAEMLRDAGASLVILGHSERRQQHGESDADVVAKVGAAHRAGLTALVCVGETKAQRDAGEALAVVGGQLAGSVPPNATSANLLLAYEPIWAIGTGVVPEEKDIAAMHGFIRRQLQDRFGADADDFRILYGGSVKPGNAAALMGVTDVDGALIGRASLKAADLLAIARAARRA